MKQGRAFTIVELLIVIVVIAILAAISVVAYNGIQTRSRNTIRINDLKQMAKVVEMYKATNGQYPISGSWAGLCQTFGSNSAYIPGVSEYYPTLPVDPRWKTPSDNRCYLYRSDGVNYTILAWVSAEGLCGDPGDACNSADIRAMDRLGHNEPTFAVYSPGAAGW